MEVTPARRMPVTPEPWAGLTFLRAAGAPARPDEPMRFATFLRHDYVAGKTKLVEAQAGTPPAETLMQALCAAYPNLADTLRQRHAQLQQLARRLIPKSRQRARRPVHHPVRGGLETAEPHAPASATTVRATPKIGRNDPCLCGSGKKYKKCCGASGQDQNT